MKRLLLLITVLTAAIAEDKMVFAEDTTLCINRRNLVTAGTIVTGPILFYSCTASVRDDELPTLHAVVDNGKIIGFTKDDAEAARLSEKYGKKFVSRTSGEGANYMLKYRLVARTLANLRRQIHPNSK